MRIRASQFALGLSVAFIGSTTFLLAASSNAQPFMGLKRYAETTAFPVNTPGNSGTLTIVGRKGSTYTFLTAAHVVDQAYAGESADVEIVNSSGNPQVVNLRVIKSFQNNGVDLAIGQFNYSGSARIDVLPLFGLAPDSSWENDPSRYRDVSIPCNDKRLSFHERCFSNKKWDQPGMCYFSGLGDAPCSSPPKVQMKERVASGSYERFRGTFNGRRYEEKVATIGDYYVAGYSLPSMAITERIFRVSEARFQNLLRRNRDGYNLIYTATSTVPGMSGGPVLAARLCPDRDYRAYAGIIGIHGKSEDYNSTSSRSGISLAIPINSPVVISFIKSNGSSLGIPVGSSYIRSVSEICSDKSRTFL